MTTDAPAPWLILGRYHVLGELGRGAMGIVYKAHDERLDRVIALKTIRKDHFAGTDLSEEEVLERFRREARAAGKLSHPGIVTVYDFSEEGEDLYLAMEFVDGEALGDRMRANPRMPVAEAARIAMRIAEALEYAHSRGVIHRDVKPDNVMCCADGTVKLTDFGIARIVSLGAATRTAHAMGTPRYMAPERWRSDPVDGRADVYALGIILYEMLTGRPAFPARSPSELKELVLHQELPLPSLVNRAVPIAINSVVRRATAREPGDRHATAGELARALAPFATDEPAAAPPAASPVGPEEAVTDVRPAEELSTRVDPTLPRVAPAATSRALPRAAAFAVVALLVAGAWWATRPKRSPRLPEPIAVATAAPVAVAAVDDAPAAADAPAAVGDAPAVDDAAAAVEPPAAIEPPAAVEPTPVAAATPELAPAYRAAAATLADPARDDEAKLAVVETLAADSDDAATDLLLEATRHPSILVSMAAVKACAGRPCGRVAAPLTALLADEAWQRRAWAAKVLGANGCADARAALAARRDTETDARVTKLMDEALATLDRKDADR